MLFEMKKLLLKRGTAATYYLCDPREERTFQECELEADRTLIKALFNCNISGINLFCVLENLQ